VLYGQTGFHYSSVRVQSPAHPHTTPLTPPPSFQTANNTISMPALTFVLAPLPNALFAHCSGDDFSASIDEGSGPVDLGRFITATVVVTGFALPLVLAHSDVIRPGACAMSIIGGAYVYLFLPSLYRARLVYYAECTDDVIKCLFFSLQFGVWHNTGLRRRVQSGGVRLINRFLLRAIFVMCTRLSEMT
jgi:hypothetical protein